MKTATSYFEKESSGLSLLYPPGASSNAGDFLDLSPAQRAAHDLGLEEIIEAFTPDRSHQNEVRKLFARLR